MYVEDKRSPYGCEIKMCEREIIGDREGCGMQRMYAHKGITGNLSIMAVAMEVINIARKRVSNKIKGNLMNLQVIIKLYCL